MISLEDYLKQNLDIKYHKHPVSIYQLITEDTCVPFKIGDKIYCTGRIRDNKKTYAIIYDHRYDGCIFQGLPNSIFYRMYNPSINNILIWIDNNLFKRLIKNATEPDIRTELVKLRIAVNMIYKLNYLSNEEKIKWSEWIKELFWNRKAVIQNWYCNCVLPEVLPF